MIYLFIVYTLNCSEDMNFLPLYMCIIIIFTAICNGDSLCHQVEKQALLSFKQSIDELDSNVVSFWNATTDCCTWPGVVCNYFTGLVQQLNLQYSPEYFSLSGKLNSSILDLKDLRHLDLSGNSFTGTIPAFIGSFSKLEYLNLSNAGFNGTIPHQIGKLSNLHTLSISMVQEPLPLRVDELEWLNGLSVLEHLDLSYVNMSNAANWLQVINKLTSLVELHLQYCNLEYIYPFDYVNLSSLSVVDLSDNNFQNVSIPNWIFQLKELVVLDLSSSSFGGLLPNQSRVTKLQQIDLSNNLLNSSIPDWLYSCHHLESVSMNNNDLHGSISESIANLTSLITLDLSDNSLSGEIPVGISVLYCHLEELKLSNNMLQGNIANALASIADCDVFAVKHIFMTKNKLSGHFPEELGKFQHLEILQLGENALSGSIPSTIGSLSSLSELRLELNKLTGNLPESFGQLRNLRLVYIAYNLLEGVVTEQHFTNLGSLYVFEAAGNHLTLKVDNNWIPPFTLGSLTLNSWNLGSEIPTWLATQKSYLWHLDLSSTGLIAEHIPDWFWDINSIDLSHNQIQGSLPDLRNNMAEFIFLSSNQFTGPLPQVSELLLVLDLSNNSISGGMSDFLCGKEYYARILNFQGNKLLGEIPNCFMNWTSLRSVNLDNNRLSGNIPDSFRFLSELAYLSFYNNRLSGQIPLSLKNCSKLEKLDLSHNNLVENLPAWIGISLPNLRFLSLRSNNLSGVLPPEICRLNYLQILDISSNHFWGLLPHCVNNLTAMTTIKENDKNETIFFQSQPFSSYADTDTIVLSKGMQLQYDTHLDLVVDINLSHNNFSGDILKEFTDLVALRSFNLSGNFLTGQIPDSIGKMRQLESLDFSMNFLTGEIPNSLSTLSAINYLNLSYNNLTGDIPKSTQLQSFPASSFEHNNLCGYPLPNSCNVDIPSNKNEEDDDGSSRFGISWFVIFLFLGYATGFSVVCTSLVLKRTWRNAYFGFVSSMWDKVYFL